MNEQLVQQFIKHIDSVVNWYYEDMTHSQREQVSSAAAHGIIARAKTIIEKVAGKNSAYYNQMQTALQDDFHVAYTADLIIGILVALKGDLLDGYLSSVTNLIHGEVFTDFLDMARHLLSEGYKDAAAVIAGGVLEAHLRQLCIKNNIATEQTTAPGKPPQAKKASLMNQELGNNIYSLFDQKNITAWLDLRNNAAHGKYSEYSASQVNLFIEGLQDFISRNPT